MCPYFQKITSASKRDSIFGTRSISRLSAETADKTCLFLCKLQKDVSVLFIYKELNSHFEHKVYYHQVD